MSAGPSKMIYLGKRNLALAPEEFPAAWKQHAVLSATVAKVATAVIGMAQCSRVLDNKVLPGASTDYDGVSVMIVTDPQTIFDSMNEPEHVALLLPDELRVFTDYVQKWTVTAKERLLHAKPVERARNKVLVIAFMRRRPGLSKEEFDARWRGAHAKLVTGQPGFADIALRYAQNAVYGECPPGYDYDGISEMWFDEIDDAGRLFTPTAVKAIDDDLAAFTDPARGVTMLTYVSHAYYVPGALSAPQPVGV